MSRHIAVPALAFATAAMVFLGSEVPAWASNALAFVSAVFVLLSLFVACCVAAIRIGADEVAPVAWETAVAYAAKAEARHWRLRAIYAIVEDAALVLAFAASGSFWLAGFYLAASSIGAIAHLSLIKDFGPTALAAKEKAAAAAAAAAEESLRP